MSGVSWAPQPASHSGRKGTWRVRAKDLLPPRRWPEGQAWPPPLEACYDRLQNVTSRSRVECVGPAREIGRYAPAVYDYAAALAIRGNESDLVEAYQLFMEIADCRRPEAGIAPAVVNAGVVLSAIPARTALALSQRALGRVAGEAAVSILARVLAASQRLQGATQALSWGWKPTLGLEAAGKEALRRLRAIPRRPIEGTWPGCVGVLLNFGLRAPERSEAGECVVLTPAKSRIEVSTAS